LRAINVRHRIGDRVSNEIISTLLAGYKKLGNQGMKLKLSKDEPILRHAENGFTMIELAVVVIIITIIFATSALSYSAISKGMSLSGAKSQVEEALNRAKTSAREENVKYMVVFYPSSGSSNPNTYELLHNVAVANPTDLMSLTWTMTPVYVSVGETATQVGGHWYIKVPNGVRITGSQITVIFSPSGSTISATWQPDFDPNGEATINLNSGSAIGSVSVDAQGNINRK